MELAYQTLSLSNHSIPDCSIRHLRVPFHFILDGFILNHYYILNHNYILNHSTLDHGIPNPVTWNVFHPFYLYSDPLCTLHPGQCPLLHCGYCSLVLVLLAVT